MTTERYEQVLNNISEEYVDLGKTRFATKKELCEVVLRLRQESDKEIERLRGALGKICCDAMMATASPQKFWYNPYSL